MTNFDLGDPAPDADEEPEEEQPDDETPLETTEQPELEPEPEPESASEPQQPAESQPGDNSDQEPDSTETGLAFPYSEVRQSPLYAHDSAWTEFEDEIDRTVVPQLREMGIRDEELREIHTVALEFLTENIEELPERLAEKRRRSG